MLQSASRGSFLLFAFVLVAACSSGPVTRTDVDRVLKAPVVANAPYRSIVLVGIAPNREFARQFEQGLEDELSARGVEVHSFVKESPAREATAEAVQALVTATGAEATLMITGRLGGMAIDEQTEIVDVEARNVGGNLLNFFRYDYEEFTEPTYTDVTVDVTMIALLFDAASNDRVYSVEVSTRHGETAYEVITAQSESIAARLLADDLID